jgi:hypothetical protein
MPLNGLHTRVAHDRPQHGGNDDGVVGVADHRKEVGYQVDRTCQIRQQQCEPYPHSTRQAAISGQPWQRPHTSASSRSASPHQPTTWTHDHQRQKAESRASDAAASRAELLGQYFWDTEIVYEQSVWIAR